MADELKVAILWVLESIGKPEFWTGLGKFRAVVEDVELRCRDFDEFREVDGALGIPFFDDFSIHLVDVRQHPERHVFVPCALVLDEDDGLAFPEE